MPSYSVKVLASEKHDSNLMHSMSINLEILRLKTLHSTSLPVCVVIICYTPDET